MGGGGEEAGFEGTLFSSSRHLFGERHTTFGVVARTFTEQGPGARVAYAPCARNRTGHLRRSALMPALRQLSELDEEIMMVRRRERANGRGGESRPCFSCVLPPGRALSFVSNIGPLPTSLLLSVGGPPRGARMPEWSNSAAPSFAPPFVAQWPHAPLAPCARVDLSHQLPSTQCLVQHGAPPRCACAAGAALLTGPGPGQQPPSPHTHAASLRKPREITA